MTPLSTINLLRTLFIVAAVLLGALIGEGRLNSPLLGAALGGLFSLVLVLTDRLLKGLTLRAFSSATFGLLLGLAFATLLRSSGVLRYEAEDTQWLISLLLYGAFGYLGTMLAIRANRDEFSLLIPYVRLSRQPEPEPPVLVDTNILIDGRVGAVVFAGFLPRSLVVPRFILEELQTLADSADPLRRERGRRGFDHLEALRRDPAITVTVHDTSTPDAPPALPTDARLVNLAKLLGCRLLSNDSGLDRVARLQGVVALNLHDLARALRPTLNTGDEIELTLVKEGRETHQAVGYLPDGTMIIVNRGRPALGQTVGVVIGSSVQTAAGRLLFGELKTTSA